MAPDPRRVGGVAGGPGPPESRKGRRKSSPLYAADDELIHVVTPGPWPPDTNRASTTGR